MNTDERSVAIKRLGALQKLMKVKKGKFNAFSKFYYRSAEDILETLKPLLASHEAITLTDEMEIIDGRFYLCSTATFHCYEQMISVNGYAREPESIKGMTSPQITGSCSSFARKYALSGLFALDNSDDDPDAAKNTAAVEAAPSMDSPHTDAQRESLFLRLAREIQLAVDKNLIKTIPGKAAPLHNEQRDKIKLLANKRLMELTRKESAHDTATDRF